MDFPDTCTIEPKTTRDGYHDLTYGTSVSVKCNYQEIQSKDPSGSNITVSGLLFLPVGSVIAMDSRVTLPYGAQPPVMEIKTIRSSVSNRVVFTRVMLGKGG